MPEPVVEKKEESAKPDATLELLKTLQASQKQLNDTLLGLHQKVETMARPAPVKTAPRKPIHETFLVDEPAALAQLKQEAKDEAKAEIKDEFQRENRMSQVRQELVVKWPELEDNSSPMTQETLKLYFALPKHEQTPASMELSALKASGRLGLKPTTERGELEEPDYVVGQSSGAPKQRREGKGSKKDDKLDPRTEEFASLLGRDPEKVKPYDRRETWGKYRGRGEK